MSNILNINRLTKLVVSAAAAALVASCATVGTNTGSLLGGMAKVDLRVTETPGPTSTFEPRTSFSVPADHKVGDKIFPYEGVGWENEIVGYRLYLDERSVTDIFGKRTPSMVLDKVDYRNDYHALAEWGMDVMKVGPSLGVGGLGLYRGDSLERFGKNAKVSADVLVESGDEVAFKVTHQQVPLAGGGTGTVNATYSLKSGSPLTWVKVQSNLPPATLASGLVNSPKSERRRNSDTVEKGEWRYIATWGDEQSEAKDGLGTVLFYKQGEARLMPSVNDTYPLRFNSPNPTYAFAGVWEQGPMGITDEQSFIAWANLEQEKLNK